MKIEALLMNHKLIKAAAPLSSFEKFRQQQQQQRLEFIDTRLIYSNIFILSIFVLQQQNVKELSCFERNVVLDTLDIHSFFCPEADKVNAPKYDTN
jgi:hypothetical protein